MELERVLVIDDSEDTLNEVLKKLKVQGIEVLKASGQSELKKHLATPPKFQMVILDWLLDGQSSTSAKVCLSMIRQFCFVPVLVWTNELATYDGEVDDVKKIFPEACLQARSKEKVKAEDLSAFLKQWYETTPAKLSNQFRLSLAGAAEASLYTLAEHSEDDLARGLKTLLGNEVDMEHTVDVLLRLVGRKLYVDKDFMDVIKETVTKLDLQNPPTTKKEIKEERKIESWQIKRLHKYYRPDDSIARTGDIIDIKIGTDEQAETYKGIIITPACDLARPRTPFLRLALIHERTTSNQSGADKYPLSALEDGKIFEVCFHEILVVENQTLAAGTSSGQQLPVMSYTHTYQTLDGTKNVTLKRNQRLDEPYRADLLHSFVSHAGRIGVPEFTAPI